MIKPLEIGKFQEVLLFNLTLSRKFMSCLRQLFTIILHINLCSCRLLRFFDLFSTFAKLLHIYWIFRPFVL